MASKRPLERPSPSPSPLPLLLLLLLLGMTQRASTLSAPAAGAGAAFLLPPTTGPTEQPQHQQQQPRPSLIAPPAPVAASPTQQPLLPLSRRRRPQHQGSRRHALPPFDTPLDPATIETMVQQGQQAAGVTSSSFQAGAVTTEQLWVGFIAGVFPFVWAGYEFWKRIDTQQRECRE
jgi:hypothetical protein